MHKNDIQRFFYLILIVFLFGSSCINKENTVFTQNKLNVIFIAVDDLRPELGCYGSTEIKTPNIDNFAKKSLLFSQAYCQVAVCQPSRASIMTGLRPDASRVWHLGDDFRKTVPDVKTIPQYFHENGYYTVSMGKIFHNHYPDSISFDEPDLRPNEYKIEGMIDRDAESFYYDDEINTELKIERDKRLAKKPRAYAGGWAYGRAVEVANAPDSALYDGAQTNLALKTLNRLKDKKQPFFLALGYYRPHLPFVAPEKYWDLYDVETLSAASNPYLPENSPVMAMNKTYELSGCYDMKNIQHPSVKQLSTDTARILKHGYFACVSYLDACVGKLLDGIKEMGLDENTIIVFWGDHGWKLGEHGSWCKQTNYDIDTNVPLIIYSPDLKNKGQKTSALVELVDLYPSLLDMAGIEVPDYLQGTSFVPLMEEPVREWKKAVFSQFHRRPNVTPDGGRYMGYSMTTEKYHYVEWCQWDNKKELKGDLVATELYNRIADPMENRNIANEIENNAIVSELAKQLKAGWRTAIPQ